MAIELFLSALAGYVIYKQESIESGLRSLRNEVSELKSFIPKRWADRDRDPHDAV